jgi:hypothetical protein
MARLLFTVTDRFHLPGRGVVPFPGIVPVEGEHFRRGDSLLLKRPDGSEIRTRIGGFEMPNPNPGPVVLVNLLELNADDVPIGTQVWSVDTAAKDDDVRVARPAVRPRGGGAE